MPNYNLSTISESVTYQGESTSRREPYSTPWPPTTPPALELNLFTVWQGQDHRVELQADSALRSSLLQWRFKSTRRSLQGSQDISAVSLALPDTSPLGQGLCGGEQGVAHHLQMICNPGHPSSLKNYMDVGLTGGVGVMGSLQLRALRQAVPFCEPLLPPISEGAPRVADLFAVLTSPQPLAGRQDRGNSRSVHSPQ